MRAQYNYNLYNNMCLFCIFIGRDSCVLFCSSHAMTSSVNYYSTDARKNKIDLLNNKAIKAVLVKLTNIFVRNDVSSLKMIALL